MVTRRYNKWGHLVGYTKSQKDIEKEQAVSSAAIALGICLLPFAPLFYLTYQTYHWLNALYGWHPLFAGLAASLPTLLGLALLWVSKWFRLIYFGLETLAATAICFTIVRENSDAIWATLAAIIVLVVGLWLTNLATAIDL